MSLARKLAIVLCAALPLAAAPALTTIQDTIYKADGTRFNGTAVISWNTFDASDASHIGMQSITVQIVNGALRVQLVPTSNANPPNLYTVQYSSDGMQQYTETWSVPPSTTPLRISAVNVVANSTSGGTGVTGGGVASPPSNSPISETNVIGLLTDLSLRPVKGAFYTNGGTAMIDSSGAIDTIQGNLSDCVHVDGSSGPCIDPNTVITNETPGGVVDGSSTSFTLANPVSPPGSLLLYRNGLLLQAGVDYNLSDSTITFVPAATPQPGDILLASYQNQPSIANLAGSLTQSSQTASSSIGSAPQVLCSASGTSTNSTSATSIGSCVIPANTLGAGDRVEVRFSLSHQGSATGFNFSVVWGSQAMVQRTASAADVIVTGHGDASLSAAVTNLDMLTWGSVLPLSPGVASTAFASGLTVTFQAAMSAAGTDAVTLENYTVIRYPAP